MREPCASHGDGRGALLRAATALLAVILLAGCAGRQPPGGAGLPDGSPCASASECAGGNCRWGVCCAAGSACCSSDGQCPEGTRCGPRHACEPAGASPGPASTAGAAGHVSPAPGASQAAAPEATPLPQPSAVRSPAVAGSFYPGSEGALRSAVQGYLGAASPPPVDGRLVAVVAPHAGYVYSGPVAAWAYKLLEGRRVTTAVVVAPSHRVPFSGAAVDDGQRYRTPLGTLDIDMELARAVLEQGRPLGRVPAAHGPEHAVEVQLPFLQAVLPGVRIVPVVMGDQDEATVEALARALAKAVGGRTDVLLIASTDLSHYESRASGGAKDRACAADIGALDDEALMRDLDSGACSMCGGGPTAAVLRAAKLLGATKAGVLKHGDSGDAAGDTSSVVGYLAAAVTGPEAAPSSAAPSAPAEPSTAVAGTDEVATADERAFLLRLARARLEDVVKGGASAEALLAGASLSERLTRDSGCFVTLNERGELRGCIGDILPERPLVRCVLGNAENAALHDYRFNPVTAAELPAIDVEVSILTAPKPLPRSSTEDLLAKLRPLVHGVVLTSGRHRATYLPQVWEQLPDKVEFLSSLCRKGGAPGECWRDPSTVVETYEAVVFGERE